MFLIVGLGNPENEYKGTRHNVGFEVVNKLAYDHGIAFSRAKLRSHFGEGFISSQKVLLAKPQTFMNLSGEATRDLLHYFRMTPSDLVVVYDDANISVGDIRIRKQGGAGGHNGMKNIVYHLETENFIRVRVGIGDNEKLSLSDHVLGKFRTHEKEAIIDGITKAGEAVELIVQNGAEAAMNRFNKTIRAGGDDI